MKKITKISRYLIKIRSLFIVDGSMGDRARGKLYEPYLKSYGVNFKVASQAMIFNPNKLDVGNNVYIGFNSYIGEGDVTINDEVLIGTFVSITASNHLRKNGSYRFGGYESKKIIIGHGTWIGANTCILAGITIGRGCLIAAGSIVTKSFGENLILGGLPAKILKHISDN